MLKKKSLLTGLVIFNLMIGLSGITLADFWNFVAPTLSDRTLVNIPQGGIYYDSTTDEFVARGANGDISLTPKICYVKDVRPQSTSGGQAILNSWELRELNTLEGDCAFLNLNSSILTIQSGKYKIDCSSPFYRADHSRSRLFDITDNQTYISGSSIFSPNNSSYGSTTAHSRIRGHLNLEQEKDFKLEYYVSSGRNTDDLGPAGGIAEEVYTQCEIKKLR